MTLAEFKAWFEGFTEGIKVVPDTSQWQRIKKRITEIDNSPTSFPVYIERYVTPYKTWWNDHNSWLQTTASSSGGFNSIGAMNYAGKAEYASL